MPFPRKEILEELQLVGSGKTLDALLPPLFFVLANGLFGLDLAVLISLGLTALLMANRLLHRQTWRYALGGFLGVGLAAAAAYGTGSAAGYFLPAIIRGAGLLLVALVSLIIGKPLAAWASHLARGWPLPWFWRKDVKPAYQEVTWMWTVLILMRLILQIFLYRSGNTTGLAWSNVVLGWPVTVPILVGSYLYGIWRLRQLSGPGVNEFLEGTPPPWKGQTRGF